MSLLADSLIDVAALGNVILYAFVSVLFVVGAFTTGIALLSTGEVGDQAAAGRRMAASLCFALCLGAVVLGVYVMLDK